MRDVEILNTLHGLMYWIEGIRGGGHQTLCVLRAAGDAQELPQEVANRLTELPIKELAAMPISPSTDQVQRMAEQISTDAVFAQVVRAVDAYRSKCSFPTQELEHQSSKQ